MRAERSMPARALALALAACAACAAPAAQALEFEGEGRGIPLPTYPSAASISAAGGLLNGRAGRTAFAVVDSSGHLSGLRVHEHFETASVVKVMMLDRLPADALGSTSRPAHGRPVAAVPDDPHLRQRSRLGGARDRGRRRRSPAWPAKSGMTDYAPGVGWWAYTQTSAADQARLLLRARPPDPRSLLRLRALSDVDDRAVPELGHPARRAAALAGVLQDGAAPSNRASSTRSPAWSDPG